MKRLSTLSSQLCVKLERAPFATLRTAGPRLLLSAILAVALGGWLDVYQSDSSLMSQAVVSGFDAETLSVQKELANGGNRLAARRVAIHYITKHEFAEGARWNFKFAELGSTRDKVEVVRDVDTPAGCSEMLVQQTREAVGRWLIGVSAADADALKTELGRLEKRCGSTKSRDVSQVDAH